MAKLTFMGGIHPYDGKELSKDKPVLEILPQGELVYPLSQHIGAPAKPVVKKGDRVLVGQMIAESGGFVSAPIYASVSGTVKTIEPRRVVTGDMINSIIIENDGLYEEIGFYPVAPVEKLTKQEIIDISYKINTFDISIEPYEDCCTVFTPKHPRTRPILKYVKEAQDKADFDALVEEALENLKVTYIRPDED